MKRFMYIPLAIGFFIVGAYVWQVRYTGFTSVKDTQESVGDYRTPSTIVEVDGEKLTQEDVDWEYQVLVEGAIDKKTLTPIPDLGSRFHEEMGALKKQIVSSLIERKVLYAYVKQDKMFTFDDPGRYVECLADWQSQTRAGTAHLKNREDRSRLRSRLCERSLLDQYLKERVFGSINVTDAEIVEYYKNHASEFKRPERVTIQQVVLPDETTAKKTRYQINPQNFSKLAEELSIAPEGAKGGTIGPYAKGSLPSVFDVAFSMRKGEVSEVLKSPYGYHIMMLVEKMPKTQLGIDQVQKQLANSVRKRKEAEEYQKWVEKALAAVSVNSPKPLW